MHGVIYMFLVGLAVLLTLKVATVVLATLFPLFILALVLFVPVAMVMAIGWIITTVWRGARRVEG
jgi:hypothetical protein